MKYLCILIFTSLKLLCFGQTENHSVNRFPSGFEISVGPNYSKYVTFEEQTYSNYTFDLIPGVGYSIEFGYTGLKDKKIPIRLSAGIDNLRGKIIVNYHTGIWYNPLMTVKSEINQTNLFIAIDPLWVTLNKLNITLGMVGDMKLANVGDASREELNVYRFMGQWSSDTLTEKVEIGNIATLGIRFSISHDINLGPHMAVAPRFNIYYTITSPFHNTFDMKIYSLRPGIDVVFKWK